ncbi:MAG: TonB-dependent receptor [Gammaproteobacteria bacterium]|nr:TonB-dependent receptor [Gammaproteobacteria bacterium]MDH5305363.1 TonB-dependent receptor [Gammaproteobacteria bacterium]
MRATPNIVVANRWRRRELCSAISAALAAGAPSVGHAQSATPASSNALEEIIVTARKRDENIQDIPQSIQAFSQADMNKSGIRGLDDIAKFVPSLTVVGSTAGLNKIVFRGLADSVRPFIADSSAAIYLDEQPLTTGAQSPEIRPIDLERVETLSGPQGTLYGASSQSGTVRYIVAKPDPSAFAANVGVGVHSIDQGDIGWDVDAMVNIPLVENKVAIRLVGFAAEDAGFIDNVLGVTPYAGTKDNADLVKEDFNSADWTGARASLKWLMNDEWSTTVIYNYTDSTINGYNDFDPTIGDLKTTKFHEESWEDNWHNIQLTLEGDLGFAQLTSSLAYFERDTAYVFDGTSGVAYYHYVFGFYGRGTCGSAIQYAYYNTYDFATACELNGSGYDIDDGDPTGFWRNDQTDKRTTFETRLTGSTSRWDWTLGFFYQKAEQLWVYGTHIDGYENTESFAAYNAIYGGLEPTDIRWNSSEANDRTDIAVFGEGTYSLSEQWKLLLGARWYDTEIDRTYTLRVPSTAPADIATPSGSDDGVLPKVGLQYFFADDAMAYVLYSEGFRTGGINRARGNIDRLALPVQYDSDLLKNVEVGLKSRWLDGSLQMNVIGYHQVWKDMQLELTDPSYTLDPPEPFQTVIANVGDAIVDGVDVELTFVPADRWELGLVSTYLFKAEIDQDIVVLFDETAPDDPDNRALDIPAGTRLPLTADLNIAAYAEYGWPMSLLGGSDAYIRVQYSQTGESFNRLVDNDADDAGDGYGGRVEQPSYDLWDLRTGIKGDTWEFTAFIDNIADERVVNFRDMNADVFWGRENVRTSMPRTVGMTMRRYFD